MTTAEILAACAASTSIRECARRLRVAYPRLAERLAALRAEGVEVQWSPHRGVATAERTQRKPLPAEPSRFMGSVKCVDCWALVIPPRVRCGWCAGVEASR